MSALIGTVIVLAITIAGIATALFMGAPVLVRMQERAALENVVGQLEEVRAAGNDMFLPDEARYPTISLPSGRIGLERGTHVMVTVTHDTAPAGCDFRVTEWEDWDDASANTKVSVAAAAPCPSPLTNTNATCAGLAAVGSGACFEAYRVTGATPSPWTLCTSSTGASCHLTWTNSGSTFTLNQPLDKDSDYLFRLTNSAGVVYGQAWLLHQDRLRWTSGGVHAAYEGGAVIAQEGTGLFLSAAPAVSEDPIGGAFYLRLTTLQGSDLGRFSGSASHTVGLVLQSGQIRIDYLDALLLRLDFHGEFAEAWCNAFLLRDVFASLDGDYYRDVAGSPASGGDSDPGHACSPDAPDPDGIHSVKYLEDDTGAVPFPFTLTQSIIHASLVL